MGVVRAVCISEKKGTEKQNVHKAKAGCGFWSERRCACR